MDYNVSMISGYNIVAKIANNVAFNVVITESVYGFKVRMQSIVQVNYGHDKYLKADFTKDDLADGFLSLGDVRNSWVIYKVSLQISTAFESGVLINVGDAVAQGRLMSQAMNNPEEVANYLTNPDYCYTVTTELKIFFAGTSATGAGKVIVYYA